MTEPNHDADHIEVDRIRSRIFALVQERFKSGAATFYLSQLGVLLGTDRVRLEKLTGKKLAEFLESELDYKFGRSGQHQNVLHIERPAQLGEPIPTPSMGRVPRYTRRFWAAFAVPIKNGEQRFINLETHEFGRSLVDSNSSKVREIQPEFATPEGGSASTGEIADRIDRWLKKESLERDRFLVKRERALEASSSLLDQLLAALDGEQLKRVSLPLDIVRTLSERR